MRAHKNYTRVVIPDSKYNSQMVTKLINAVMSDGKKSVATKQVYDALSLLKEQTKVDEMTYINEALENVKPAMEVRSRRVGGASYQVPVPVRNERKQTLAIRWIIDAARARSNSSYHSFAAKLVAEVIEAHEQTGNAMKKKLDTHRMADANKAFSHFRW
ncbi:30S ribosomal protein S7 [Candidatus Collierbacteria bacterium RIFCSPLOWO2_01_FULL_50_23]|uniref:Small ribosomal subunit protein uS7 n=2 Tax=Candidatus Collieribacteriota TaxID=1752725 RepID=A0A1F5EUR9_9BACT|nr:MAG: 30S ribosomal protein S7 [Candidatus Collierbacteria bacterium RIFCSPHIGHO2_02_FULL_49_10]OGD71677.1 MAG: 30S ribosomal protein S7 [Candidatus Collierbacteria bacterium RIFCSPHIGHO2_01_FULL_50_25]OGD73989.1 MAG: 30S ribosomal protein S7 [Candidatus Collierbacteria bacterium RIFCSPLOWO2_01_FULL_50_23]